MFQVEVCPDTNQTHVLQIYAGLYDLQALGKIRLKLVRHFLSEVRHFKAFTLLIQVKELYSGQVRRICFDMVDSDRIASRDALVKCDVYFKRSFLKSSVDILPLKLKDKVLPYGFYYPCISKNEKNVIKRLLFEFSIRYSESRSNIPQLKKIFVQALKIINSRFRLRFLDKSLFGFTDDIEIPPTQPAEQIILLQTRLWSPSEVCATEDLIKLDEMNRLRVNLVRVLKEKFGDRFVGGLIPTDFAKKHYPDHITTLSTNKQQYLKLIKRCLITIASTGLSNSIGSRFPEYLAASRCIISEPLGYEVPAPPDRYRNYIPFNTPQECVEACEFLLRNQRLASEMRWNNWEYYQKHVKPSALIANCLKRAFL